MLYTFGFIHFKCISLTMPEGEAFNSCLKIKLLKLLLRESMANDVLCICLCVYTHIELTNKVSHN